MIYLIAKPKFYLVPKANHVGDVWKFEHETKSEHPCAFPARLPERIIGSTNAAVILDPFVGSGTTAVAAKRLNRQYVGIELSPDYCDMAEARIRNEMKRSQQQFFNQ